MVVCVCVRKASKFYFFLELNVCPAQLPRGLLRFSRVVCFFIGAQEGYAVCLDTKVTKKSSQQKCFFAAPGLSRTKPKKLRAGIFLPD